MNTTRVLAAVVAAIFVVLVVHRVRQRRFARAAFGTLLGLLLALYSGGVVTGTPDPRSAIEGSADALGQWNYLVVAAMAFFETSAPPLTVVFPGEWGVAYGGLLAREGTLNIVPLVGIVWAASLLGDSWAFFLGRRLGRSYLVAHGEKLGVTHARLTTLDSFFDRWGAATVAVGRLLPIARPFVAVMAGASEWPYRRFLTWNLVGTGLFAVAFTLLGYAAYATAERVVETGSSPWFIATSALLIALLAVLLRRRMSK